MFPSPSPCEEVKLSFILFYALNNTEMENYAASGTCNRVRSCYLAQIVSCARCTENIHIQLKKKAALNLISNLVYLCVKTE